MRWLQELLLVVCVFIHLEKQAAVTVARADCILNQIPWKSSTEGTASNIKRLHDFLDSIYFYSVKKAMKKKVIQNAAASYVLITFFSPTPVV